MKSSDIVAQLQNLLPGQTTRLSSRVAVSLAWLNLTVTGTTVEPHGLATGDAVVIEGMEWPIKVTGTRNAVAGSLKATLVTSIDHDLTEGILPLNAAKNPYVTLSGDSDSDWNVDAVVTSIDNRRTLQIELPARPSADTTANTVLNDSGAPYKGLNRSYTVREVTELTFIVQAPFGLGAGEAAPAGTQFVHSAPRVSAAASPERAIQAYTSQKTEELWAFVVLGDVTASKSREMDSDAIDNQITDDTFRQQIAQPFSIYVMFPATHSIGGAEPKDLAQDLMLPICRSVLGTKFSSGLSNDKQGSVQFGGHGEFLYDGPLYVHQYAFQQTVDLLFPDTVGPSVDVAFRNINLTVFPALGLDDTADTAISETLLDLDDVQLP